MTAFSIRPLDAGDKGYALSSWREAHKQSPGCDKVPWGYYKHEWGTMFKRVLDAPDTKLLGAYDENEKLLGWLAMTPGKRVHTLHWVQIKFDTGSEKLRRRGLMLALLEAAELGGSFIYTLRARRHKDTLPDGTVTKSLDETLASALRARGVTATFVALKAWLQ